MKTFLLIVSWIIVGWIGYKVGKNSGYNLGYNRGYHQCCEDYNLYDKERISRLEYFQDRDFEIKTGIYQERMYGFPMVSREIKPEEFIEYGSKKIDDEINNGTLLSISNTDGGDLSVYLLPNILKAESAILWPEQKFFKATLSLLKIDKDPDYEDSIKKIAEKLRERIDLEINT